ncbi:MAG: cyanophycinase [Planctomycetes bacterium]|nr:cyanophycinase [Planctomycetota bacterium]
MIDPLDAPPGPLMPIGGAEAKDGAMSVLARFVELAGGAAAEIAIVPTASRLRDTGLRYEELFAALGARTARSLRFRSRHDAEQKTLRAALAGASGIFLTGGNQSRLTRVLRDTPCGDALLEANRRGVIVAGTSAGAAVMSDPMIASGSAGLRPRRGMVTLEPGLGLAAHWVVDQHFGQRRRLGRLVEAVLALGRPGLGVDEDTAAVLHADGSVEVVGSGAVTLVRAGAGRAANLLALLDDPETLLRPPPRTSRERDEACVNADRRGREPRARRERAGDHDLDLASVRVERLGHGELRRPSVEHARVGPREGERPGGRRER